MQSILSVIECGASSNYWNPVCWSLTMMMLVHILLAKVWKIHMCWAWWLGINGKMQDCYGSVCMQISTLGPEAKADGVFVLFLGQTDLHN